MMPRAPLALCSVTSTTAASKGVPFNLPDATSREPTPQAVLHWCRAEGLAESCALEEQIEHIIESA